MRSILLILTVAGIWAGTGVIVGVGLSAYFGVNWIVECGSLNLALGMIFLQLVTRSEVGRKLFYEGVREEDQLHLGIAFFVGNSSVNGSSGRVVVADWQVLSAVAVTGVRRSKSQKGRSPKVVRQTKAQTTQYATTTQPEYTMVIQQDTLPSQS